MNEIDLIETRRVLETYGEETLQSMRNILSNANKSIEMLTPVKIKM